MKTDMIIRFCIRQGVLDCVNSWWQLGKALHNNGAVPLSGRELGGA